MFESVGWVRQITLTGVDIIQSFEGPTEQKVGGRVNWLSPLELGHPSAAPGAWAFGTRTQTDTGGSPDPQAFRLRLSDIAPFPCPASPACGGQLVVLLGLHNPMCQPCDKSL